jgi:solute carrier family 25 carnitine/acylcarnitine transporter 20/29
MQAAVLSGACISLIVAPMEGVKARLQVNYAAKGQGGLYAGPIDCIKKLVTGPLGLSRGLYRGWLPTALCRMSNWSYFGAYEAIRQQVTPIFSKPTLDGSPPPRSLPAAVISGGSAGICYWLSCYPLDVIKNRMQAAPDTSPPLYRGMADAARVIYTENGIRGFFKGFTPCALRAFPANASCFLAFEVVLKILPEKL